MKARNENATAGATTTNGKPSEVVKESSKKVTPQGGKNARHSELADGKVSDAAPWNFPKNTLEEAIRIPQVIEEKNAGKPLDATTLATYVGYHKANDWRFLALLRSANLYGLVEGSGQRATVAVEKIGEGVVAPSSPSQRQLSLGAAFDNVELFKKVAAYYKNKIIPEDEYFANTLSREFHVPRERLDHFIRVFTSNLNYLKAFAAIGNGRPVLKSYGSPPIDIPEKGEDTSGAPAGEAKDLGVRQFLDTCFVLMPFGGWNDRYFEEIYKGAIKDAGFEPVRGDDMFHSGSVMEQIWEEVKKAKVLLAELTGKNPNVFYELGLAHALSKPVVFVAATMDDVPFDLRHLRVIVYEHKEPGWDKKLRDNIAAYLKNAKTEPAKSIPQPFRKSESADLEPDERPEADDERVPPKK
jgi:hypothetical protein